MTRLATRRTCEDLHRLDVRALARDGLLTRSGAITWSRGDRVICVRGDGDGVTLAYAVDGQEIQERVPIDRTPVHLGGHRPWFLCPGCSRRVAVLYGDRLFRCRHCHDLRYVSQRESATSRAISRIQRVRRRLGASGDLTQPVPRRPRYMHQSTFERLLREEAEAWQAFASMGLR